MFKSARISIVYAPYFLLALITLLAVLLRFYKLGEWSFWGDEIFTLGSKTDGFVPSLTTRLIHITTAFLGVNEWNARLIPALVGVISIPILFILISTLFGKSVGLISSALLAVSTWHIYWSQNARFYILLLLFYSLALLCFYLGLERDRPWFMLLSLIFWGLAVQERMLAVILLPVIVIYLIVLFILPFDRPPGLNIKNLVIFFMPGLIAALIFASPFLGNLSVWLTGYGRINNNPLWLFSGFVYYVGFPIICMAGFSIVFLLIRKERAGLFFGISAIMPILLIMAVSIFQYSANRYFFFSLISWIILASLASFELIKSQKGETKLLAIGVLVLLIGSSLSEDFLYYRYQNGNRENWRAAFELIKAEEMANDLVFMGDPDTGNYYLERPTLQLTKFDENLLSKTDRRAWFIIDITTEELYPQELAWIEKNAWPVGNFDVSVRGRVFKMRVYLFDPAVGQNPISLNTSPLTGFEDCLNQKTISSF